MSKNVQLARHYQNLANSPYLVAINEPYHCPNARYFSDNLIRLPLFVELTNEEQEYILKEIIKAV